MTSLAAHRICSLVSGYRGYHENVIFERENVISRRAMLALPAVFSTACRRPEPDSRGYAFIANQDGGAIAALDLDVMAVAKHVAVDGAPSQVISAQSRPAVYALTPTNGTVHEIRTDTLKVGRKLTAAAHADSIFMSSDEKTIYILSRETRSVHALRLDDWRIAWSLQFPEEPVDFALSPDGNTAAVSSSTTLRLVSLTARSIGQPLGRTNFGQILFLKNGERLVAADLGNQQISVYRVNNPRLVTHLTVAVLPENLCFSSDGGQLFVTGSGMDSMVILYPYDIPEVAETILVGHAPAAMTASEALLFITSPASGDVTVLSIATHKVLSVMPVGSDPGLVAITPDDRFALVLNRESGNVAVLDNAEILKNRNKSAALVTVIPVGSRPVSAAMHS
jgi:DNA-binding beta-propeller fold protein YncE